MHYRGELTVQTRGRGAYQITTEVANLVATSGAKDGLATVFIHHTSASLMLCENADPAVLRDLEAFTAKLVPDGHAMFEHNAEGPDDMPAHIRSVLTQTSVGIPIISGRLGLGTWQGLFVWEHRTVAHQRRVTVTILAD